ncbi:Required for respiratory growth protein 7, mitochondrial [Nakaseomyces bracarensis]|uniref:Required for respiratory growth protein 7, mitochondrial n=1 Tax=Nakaseomyces bracarensis TaxID=273131 RepID=A0ABR4NZW8_9SACH
MTCFRLFSVRRLSSCSDDILRFIRDNRAISGSTVHKGTLYELTVERELRRKLLMEQLNVVGGANDGGVDLTCKWPVGSIYKRCLARTVISGPSLPMKGARLNGRLIRPLINQVAGTTSPSALTIDGVVQCKAFTGKISPKEIRELAGTFLSLYPNRKSDGSGVAIMCSPHLLTPSSIKLIDQLSIPFLYLRIDTLRMLNSEDYDINNSGNLLGHMSNQVLKHYLAGTGFEEWMKFELYNEY